MLRLKALLFTAIWISIAQNVQAQSHYNAWFRTTLSVPIGSKVKTDTEFQHRRQNGFENENMFDRKLMFTLRNWVHYQHNPALKFSISPFAYFSHYKVIQHQTDETAKSGNEIRFSVAAEWQHKLFEKWYIVDRSAAEYRIFNTTQSDVSRFRNRLGIRYDFTEQIKLTVYDELFVNVTGTSNAHFFDHNRIGFNVEYHVLPNLKFDIGYIYIVRQPLAATTKLYENNTFLNLTYQFKKKIDTSK